MREDDEFEGSLYRQERDELKFTTYADYYKQWEHEDFIADQNISDDVHVPSEDEDFTTMDNLATDYTDYEESPSLSLYMMSKSDFF